MDSKETLIALYRLKTIIQEVNIESEGHYDCLPMVITMKANPNLQHSDIHHYCIRKDADCNDCPLAYRTQPKLKESLNQIALEDILDGDS